MADDETGESKAVARATARAQAQPGRVVCAELADWLIGRAVTRVAGFWPIPGEVDPTQVLGTLASRGVRVVLPRMSGDRLEFVECDPRERASLRRGRFGVLEPAGPAVADLADCDAVLVPALACDRAGNRLGRGGGFYDRALAQVPQPRTVVAVVHEAQVWPAGAVPAQPHDQRVSAIATPTGLIHIHQ